MPPIGSTPSNPACFIARNFSSTEPFTPIVEYIMALRSLRVEAAETVGVIASVTTPPAVIFRNDRRFITRRMFPLFRQLGLQDVIPAFAICRALDKRRGLRCIGRLQILV